MRGRHREGEEGSIASVIGCVSSKEFIEVSLSTHVSAQTNTLTFHSQHTFLRCTLTTPQMVTAAAAIVLSEKLGKE